MKTSTFSAIAALSLMALFIVFLSGCPTNPPKTVDSVDVARYAGKWYEIARYPVVFQRGLVGVTAEYTQNPDGTVGVFNRGLRKTLDGPESTITAVAKVVDTTTNSKLSVRFDRFPISLFPADYWIVDLGENYDYAAVSGPSRQFLWILSRTPQMDAAVYDGILERLTTNGFDVSKLEKTLQPAS